MKSYRLPLIFLQVVLVLNAPVFATKLVTYTFRGETRLGAWVENGIVDLNRAYVSLLQQERTARARARADAMVPPDMLAFLQGEEESMQAGLEAIKHVQKSLRTSGAFEKLKELGVLFTHDEIKLEAPLTNPPHLLSLGLNYRQHADETGSQVPQHPIIFTKEGEVIGPGAPIRIPPAVQKPDYEAELVFVMGKRAYQVSEEKALDYVAGYSTFNDVSARALQSRVSQWTLGKSVDTFSVMGPYLVLKDEISDPHQLRISTRIGDEVLQDSNTSDMIFTIPQVIAYISQVMALEPGTVITTGTPQGVGSARQPPRFLRPGDTVIVEIEKLGVLSNPVTRD